jgi:hypothetical protein
MAIKKDWIVIAFVNFFIASLLGLFLRWAHVHEIPWIGFRKVMYAHFHVSMLGWLYLVLYAFIWSTFIDRSRRDNPLYNRLFWFTQASVIGITLSFSFQGYGIASVIFVLLHMMAGYLFFLLVWRESSANKQPSELLLRTSLLWMLLSTVGVWVVSWLVIGNTRNIALYHMAIQFFLHFQFNGWFTFAVLALFFKELEKRGHTFNARQFRWFYWLLVVSCTLTYALSVVWSSPYKLLFFVNGAGVLIQMAAMAALTMMIRRLLAGFVHGLPALVKAFYLLAMISFVSKILIQSVVVFPQVAVISVTIRQFVVGFVHLTVLGSISAFIVGLLLQKGMISTSSVIGKWGSWVFLISFILMEIMLFKQGSLLWLNRGFLSFYYETMLLLTLMLTFGIFILLLDIAGRKKSVKKPVYIY